ncbi:MAG: hypothetical protein ACAI44_03185 [Candidatus Sericytochromatia bacterium]
MEGILALLIPIIAIIVWSPVGKSIAHAISAGAQGASGASGADVAALQARLDELEARLSEQGGQVRQLQESSEFYKQLIEGSAPPEAAG